VSTNFGTFQDSYLCVTQKWTGREHCDPPSPPPITHRQGRRRITECRQSCQISVMFLFVACKYHSILPYCVLRIYSSIIQSVQFKMLHNNNHVLQYNNGIRSRCGCEHVCSRAQRVFILEYYFISKSFAAVSEELCSDKAEPNKTTLHQVVRKFRGTESVYL
jgi:hypothetical protein